MDFTNIIIAIVVVLILYFVFNTMIGNRRQIAFNKIDAYYDEMELYVVQNKLNPNNELIEYLKRYKQFKVNNELADIQVLIGLVMIAITKQRQLNKSLVIQQKISSDMPAELVQIGHKIDKEIVRAIRLSMYKPDCLSFIAYVIAKGLVKSTFNFSSNWLGNLISTSRKALNDAEVAIFYNSSLTSC